MLCTSCLVYAIGVTLCLVCLCDCIPLVNVCYVVCVDLCVSRPLWVLVLSYMYTLALCTLTTCITWTIVVDTVTCSVVLFHCLSWSFVWLVLLLLVYSWLTRVRSGTRLMGGSCGCYSPEVVHLWWGRSMVTHGWLDSHDHYRPDVTIFLCASKFLSTFTTSVTRYSFTCNLLG